MNLTMAILDILVAIAIAALSGGLQQIVDAIDDGLDERGEIREVERRNRLLAAELKEEREAHQARVQERRTAIERIDRLQEPHQHPGPPHAADPPTKN